MARGGKRDGAGRKSQGVTKKVSLTLTQEEWDYLNSLDMKLVTFIKEAISSKQSILVISNDAADDSISKLYARKLGKLEGLVDIAISRFKDINSRPLPSHPTSKRLEELEKRLECASKYLDESYFFQ